MRSTPSEVCGHVRVRVTNLITTRARDEIHLNRGAGVGDAAPNHLRPTPPRQCHPPPSRGNRQSRHPGDAVAFPQGGGGERVVRRPSPRLPTAPRRDGLGTARRDANLSYFVHMHDRTMTGVPEAARRNPRAAPGTPVHHPLG